MIVALSRKWLWSVLLTAAWLMLVPSARAQLTVVQKKDTIIVSSTQAPTWKATVDGTFGGVISALHLPADSPNLAQTPKKNAIGGLCTMFYGSDLEKAGKVTRGFLNIHGTLTGLKILSQSDAKVVVEVQGKASGVRLWGSVDEKLMAYKQTYTFLPDRIVCSGEVTWTYGHKSRLKTLGLQCFFAPDTVSYPIRLAGAGKDAGNRKLVHSGKGAAVSFKIPADAPDKAVFWARLAVKDSSGLRGEEYVAVEVDNPKAPPSKEKTDPQLKQKIDAADIVVLGKVSQTGLSSASSFDVGVIEVREVLKGDAKTKTVHFKFISSGSGQVAPYGKKGVDGVWMLGKKGGYLEAREVLSYLPVQDLEAVRKIVLKTAKAGK